VLQLNFDLCPTATITPMNLTSSGARRYQVNVRPNLPITIQFSPDLIRWSTLLTTNPPGATCEFFDSPSSPGRRFYRAQVCP